jgi:hypothetical protein
MPPGGSSQARRLQIRRVLFQYNRSKSDRHAGHSGERGHSWLRDQPAHGQDVLSKDSLNATVQSTATEQVPRRCRCLPRRKRNALPGAHILRNSEENQGCQRFRKLSVRGPSRRRSLLLVCLSRLSLSNMQRSLSNCMVPPTCPRKHDFRQIFRHCVARLLRDGLRSKTHRQSIAQNLARRESLRRLARSAGEALPPGRM